MKVSGIVTSGAGQGAKFLALDWVAAQIQHHLTLTSFPGTLNLRVERAVRAALFAQRHGFLRIADPSAPDCPGYLKKVGLRANGRRCDEAWVILPEKTMYDDVLEIISAYNLRETLALKDGDPVEIELQ